MVNALDFIVIEPHTQSIYVHNDEKTNNVLHKVLDTISVDEYIESFKKGNLIDIFPAAIKEAGGEGFKDGQFVIMPKKFYVDQCYEMSKEIERLTNLIDHQEELKVKLYTQNTKAKFVNGFVYEQVFDEKLLQLLINETQEMVYKDAKFKELIDQALDTGDKKWFEEKIQQEKMKG